MFNGEESEAWTSSVTTLEDLVWSVQPKRSTEDRKHLVALLPSLLKRMNAGMHPRDWPENERERFMSNLVEAHAAAVKPSLAHVDSPTAAVAEQAKAQAEVAKAAADEAMASRLPPLERHLGVRPGRARTRFSTTSTRDRAPPARVGRVRERLAS
jgi:hypothetical protein